MPIRIYPTTGFKKELKRTVYLAEILLKSEHDTVDVNKVIQRLKDEGLL